MEPVGRTRWVIAEGYIPPNSSYDSRALVSHEAAASSTPATRTRMSPSPCSLPTASQLDRIW